MSIVALARIALVNALPDFGDRNIQGLSTVIKNDEWHLETDFHHGSIGDVTLYHNKNFHVRGEAPRWEWYAAIPTANIKGYRLEGEVPPPSAMESDAESEAESPAQAHRPAISARNA